jgi:Protein of unknown function (DUF4242)
MDARTYLLETYMTRTSADGPAAAAARARAAAAQMTREGTPIRVLRSFFAPEDELWFCLFEARSSEAVTEASRRAEFGLGRIQKAVDADTTARARRSERSKRRRNGPQ